MKTTQVNILWQGREYHSLENCLVTMNDSGAEVSSTIVGSYHQDIYKIGYLIKTNKDWQTAYCKVEAQAFDKTEQFVFESDGNGHWTMNGKLASEFDGCTDVDIPLTPFTNTLPINRLGLRINESREVKVIYIDILAKEIKPVLQKYIRLSLSQYQYENVPNDFEAVITVDDMGLVIDYPELFECTDIRESRYGV